MGCMLSTLSTTGSKSLLGYKHTLWVPLLHDGLIHTIDGVMVNTSLPALCPHLAKHISPYLMRLCPVLHNILFPTHWLLYTPYPSTTKSVVTSQVSHPS